MNFGRLAEITGGINSNEGGYKYSDLDLVAGIDKGLWNEMVNLRLKVDGEYVFWRARGGTQLVKTLAGNVITAYPFSARVNGNLYDYIVMQTSMGNIELWNATLDSTTQIMTGVPTSDKVQIVHRGIFIYVFEYDGGVAKYYDLERAQLNDFLDYDYGYITDYNFVGQPIEDDNFLGFREGKQVLVFPNFASETGLEVLSSSTGAGQLDPNKYSTRSFLYNYNGGKYLIDSQGVEYKDSQFFSFALNDPAMTYTVGGAGADFTIEQFYVPLNAAGDVAFESYVATINKVYSVGALGNFTVTWKDPVGIPNAVVMGGVLPGDVGNTNLVLPYTDDIEDLVGQPSNKILASDNVTIVANTDYVEPVLYRQYALLDILNDASVTMTGKPQQVELRGEDLLTSPTTGVRLNVTPPSQGVERRYLASSRWQGSAEEAFVPSSENYPDSPLFIIKEVNKNRIFTEDYTRDSKLQRFANEVLPSSAGIADLFGAGQLSPNSIAPFTGSLLMAGYTVNRPIPIPYTNPVTALRENIFVNIQATTQLPNNMSLSFQYEYTDGKRSNIVDTAEFLQEGSSFASQPVTCNQVKASATHEVLTGTLYDGEIHVAYEGVTVSVPLTVASHPSPADVAEAIRQAVQGSPEIQISANVPSGANIDYEEKRFGEEFNGNLVDLTSIIPWIVEDATFVASGSVAAVDNLPRGIYVKPDGTKLYITGNQLNSVDEFDMSTAWDVTTLASVADFSVNTQASNPQDVFFSSDGLSFYVVTAGADVVAQYDMSTAWSVATATFNQTFSVASESLVPTGLCFSEDGLNMYITDDSVKKIFQYKLSTAWDISTASFTTGDEFLTSGDVSGLQGITIKDDGRKIYVVSSSDQTVQEYELSTAFDIKTCVAHVSFVATTNSPDPRGIWLIGDGTRMYLIDEDDDAVKQYDLPDDIGVTFDNKDVNLAGAAEPEGLFAEATIVVTDNTLTAGQTGEVSQEVDGNFTSSVTIYGEDTIEDAANTLRANMATDPVIPNEWLIGPVQTYMVNGNPYPGYKITALNIGSAWNGKLVAVELVEQFSINVSVGAPGKPWVPFEQTTAGGSEGCLQATGSLEATANNLAGAATEDHTITIDGTSTAPVTILDTDTLNDVAVKWKAAIEAVPALHTTYKAVVTGGLLDIIYRQYGTVGNDKVISLTGNVDVSVTTVSPTAGGDDGGTTPVGEATEVNANRLQIHSLNGLVTKVYILGKTTDGGDVYHLIKEVQIDEAEAHGKIIDLPNTEAELTVIEADIFTEPQVDDVRESLDLENYFMVGTPYQQFNISAQKPTVDEAKILRVIPLDFDVDKSSMRYKLAIFTDENIQWAYLTEQATQFGQSFLANVEVVHNNVVLTNRTGVSLIQDIIPFQDQDGVYLLSRSGELQKILPKERLSVIRDNTILDTVFNRRENEYWFICNNNDVAVYDADTGAWNIMRLGPTKTLYSGAFANDKLYIGMNNALYETDVDGLVQDYTNETTPDAIPCVATTNHVGNMGVKSTLKELLIAGQKFNVSVDLDLQPGRKETGGAVWSKVFNSDVNFAAKEIKMYGESYQLNNTAVMPRIQLSFDAIADGFISTIRLKSNITENTGKPRE